nr:hypothetical protein [Gemella palaticanis]
MFITIPAPTKAPIEDKPFRYFMLSCENLSSVILAEQSTFISLLDIPKIFNSPILDKIVATHFFPDLYNLTLTFLSIS